MAEVPNSPKRMLWQEEKKRRSSCGTVQASVLDWLLHVGKSSEKRQDAQNSASFLLDKKVMRLPFMWALLSLLAV